MKLSELAGLLGADLFGEGQDSIDNVSSLSRANLTSVTFYSDVRRLEELRKCHAGAVILHDTDKDYFAGNCLIVSDPYSSFVSACHILHPTKTKTFGIHHTAQVHKSTKVGVGVSIGPGCSVGSGTHIGPGCTLGSCVEVGDDVSLGNNTVIDANVSVYSNSVIGNDCRIKAGAVIGSPGFGYVPGAEGWQSIPQLGRVVIGDRVDIGANTTIDRGSLDDTIIEDGVKLDNQIQIAHNVKIGQDTAIAGCTGIAGSATIGRRCRIGGRVSILGHLEIADDIQINATSVVTGSLKVPGVYSSNLTVQESGHWLKTVARLPQLDRLFRRVRDLEKTLKRFS
ncbi:MAG: UDP-3-O-[3-hydroxymyristoyl] glucosamine N-acyltransferase [Parasphingorhabdus sp.]|jgi:UDP-3-O-[3-hydroxymyristoyl] glucosamine N-acyltransferase